MQNFYTVFSTKFGEIKLTGNADGLISLEFIEESSEDLILKRNDDFFKKEVEQIAEFTQGKRKNFYLKLNISSGTEFQKKVWQELIKIPYGETISYSDLASRVGNPKTTRVV